MRMTTTTRQAAAAELGCRIRRPWLVVLAFCAFTETFSTAWPGGGARRWVLSHVLKRKTHAK
jgi:hypothetical protein